MRYPVVTIRCWDDIQVDEDVSDAIVSEKLDSHVIIEEPSRSALLTKVHLDRPVKWGQIICCPLPCMSMSGWAALFKVLRIYKDGTVDIESVSPPRRVAALST